MKKISLLLLSVLFVLSCEKDEKLTFSEVNVLLEDNGTIEINIPKANTTSSVGNSINSVIENHIANDLNLSEDDSKSITLDDAVKKFNLDYTTFKDDYNEGSLIWEATFDGEIIYQTETVLSISLSSYINTGGAHGNANIRLLNFNPQTGELYTIKDIVENKTELISIVKTYFAKELQLENNESFEDFFFGKNFQLPTNIGFNDEGLLILYNVYEIASYDQGITEFTIPIDEVKSFLKIY